MEVDNHTLIVLGRLFLATVGYRIDVKNGKLPFDIGGDHVEFNLFKALKFPSISDVFHIIDVISTLVSDEVTNYVPSDHLEHCMLNNGNFKDENPEVTRCEHFLEASPQPSLARVKELMSDDKASSYEEHATK